MIFCYKGEQFSKVIILLLQHNQYKRYTQYKSVICDRMVMPCQHNHGVQYIHSCTEEWSCTDTTHKKA